jgi:hypothetical protein
VCIKATAAIGDVSIPRRPKKSSTGVKTVFRRSSHRSVSSASSSAFGIESLETRSLMSATLPLDAAPKPDAFMPALLLPAKATPASLPVPGDIVGTGPGGGPHVDGLIIPGPHLHPGGVNVNQGTVYTITFGGTLAG